MLQVIGTLKRKKLSKSMSNALCYAIQVDGGADRAKKTIHL